MPPADAARTLAAAQRMLWRIIVAPQGVEVALRELESADGVAGTEQLAALIRGDAQLPATRRVGVYASAYFERIRGVLEADFRALRAFLGEAPFHDLATSYLAVHPPQHFSLRYAGARLPEFLRVHEAGDPFRKRWPWGADLARLEWALGEAFDAADSPTARRDDLAQVAAERWAELALELSPSLRLVEVGWNVHTLRRCFEANEGEADEGSGASDDTPCEREGTLCVWRDSERVFHRELDRHESQALRATAQGAHFGALCELAERLLGEDQAAQGAAAWLARWLDDGMLARVALPE